MSNKLSFINIRIQKGSYVRYWNCVEQVCLPVPVFITNGHREHSENKLWYIVDVLGLKINCIGHRP
jgi:hypothetical protein